MVSSSCIQVQRIIVEEPNYVVIGLMGSFGLLRYYIPQNHKTSAVDNQRVVYKYTYNFMNKVNLAGLEYWRVILGVIILGSFTIRPFVQPVGAHTSKLQVPGAEMYGSCH